MSTHAYFVQQIQLNGGHTDTHSHMTHEHAMHTHHILCLLVLSLSLSQSLSLHPPSFLSISHAHTHLQEEFGSSSLEKTTALKSKNVGRGRGGRSTFEHTKKHQDVGKNTFQRVTHDDDDYVEV